MIGRHKLFICTQAGQKLGSREVEEWKDWKQMENMNKNLCLCKNEQIILPERQQVKILGFRSPGDL